MVILDFLKRVIIGDDDEGCSDPPNRNSDPIFNQETNSVGPPFALTHLDSHTRDEMFSSEEHYEWFKEYSNFQRLIWQGRDVFFRGTL
ncbi:unnamed protein product [Microthlaspi erraticum]|uniref:Uncharacterized protein n=1 Tax=Microthlaspi erraticum TaxID=1685480 RepID=A0A6D2LLT5_9BRAS|nr:unnamed protein product [Microthlaspi erraticum]